ncbi:MAG: LPXTG cell wall anchor domain-containing protein [Acidimicrobiales bacterium]|nr:LPXTG cell wall anchor domain-containing protein [Acidimicrobiales bacterium]
MRKALALLATVGAFMMLSFGIAGAQVDYDGDETTTTTEATTTTTEDVVTTTTEAPTTTTEDPSGIEGEGDATDPGTLPATGNDSLPLAQMAIVLVAAGGIALLAVRRTPAKVSTGS